MRFTKKHPTIDEAKAILEEKGIKFTRRDYMDKKVGYYTYESQFVNEETIRLVERHIGKERILSSTDEHFNDIPLREWDALSGVVYPVWSQDRRIERGTVPSVPGSYLVALSNMFTQSPDNAVPSISLADCVSLLKSAARIIKTRTQESQEKG